MSLTDLLAFINDSPSPFHAVAQAITLLQRAGFVEIKETEDWKITIRNNGKYYFTRNRSTLVAFAVGGHYAQGCGFSMIGAHTDSPCLKLKPRSYIERDGYMQVGVQQYGGGIWASWFDRDLSVAGRAMIREADGSYRHALVNLLPEPILRIPNLAIHLNREVNDDFKFGKEDQFVPVFGLRSASRVAGLSPQNNHHSELLDRLARAADTSPDRIVDFELCLADCQPGVVAGANGEFIFAARIDNLYSSYCAVAALSQAESLDSDSNVRLVVLFDNEEIGSQSAYGADSALLTTTIERIALSFGNQADALQGLQKSFLISADMAHAVHPNYGEKHERNHRPVINGGPVVKFNANQRYATTAVTSCILREVALRAGVPLQEFVVRNDAVCGSTIGPITSSQLGVRTIDIGCGQLSMHSIREMAGAHDVEPYTKLMRVFFEQFASIDRSVQCD